MKILVACEESQTVMKAFRAKGHDAWSCDIQDCSGGDPLHHIKADVLTMIDDDWDMIIAFPPCTYLSGAGNSCFSEKRFPIEKIEERKKLREKAAEFFLVFANCKCAKVAIENPVGYMNTHYRKPDQIIHPYYFGEPYMKRTCLWLRGLPKLEYTNVLPKPEPLSISNGKITKGKKRNWVESCKGGKDRQKIRSKTFQGVALAMAEQWG